MIINLLLNLIVLIVGALFVWFPQVTKLPTIYGWDIDDTLTTYMGMFHRFIEAVWPLQIVYDGFLFLMGYYILKMVVRLFLGHRAPGHNG